VAKVNSEILDAPDLLLMVLDRFLTEEIKRLIKLTHLVASNPNEFTEYDLAHRCD